MYIFTKFFNQFKFILYYYSLSLILSSLVLFSFKYELLYIITKPFLIKDFQFSEIILTNLFEAIQYYLLIIITVTLLINIPVFIIYFFNYIVQFLNNISISYYKKLYLKLFLCCIVFNFIFLYWILPNILNYFLTFQNLQENYPLTLKLQLKLSEYIGLYLKIFLYFNLFLYFCILLQKTEKWIKIKKYIYFSILVLISFITPPDLLSILFITLPIIIIFEFLHIYKKVQKYYKF